MMFSCCHPRLPEEAQLALILNILCGFGAERDRGRVPDRPRGDREADRARQEGAGRREAAVRSRRRRVRARACRRCGARSTCCSTRAITARPPSRPVRAELCDEAMRLTALLREHPPAATPATHALAALMCLHAARLPARVDAAGDLSALVDQDRSRWDARLVAEGLALLERSAAGRRADARTTSRRRSPRRTPARAASTRPTGQRSWRSTTG